MAVVGTPPEQYQKYAKAIACEYQAEKLGDLYTQGRTQFLQGVINKERIFVTDLFEDQYKDQTIANAKNEIAMLTQKAIRKPQINPPS